MNTGRVRNDQRDVVSLLTNNEQGVAIITALLILLLLTFVGIVATKTVITDKRIVRSDAIFEQNFYLAESAALEGIQKLDNKSTPDELLAPLLGPTAENKDLLVSADTENPKSDLENLDRDNDGDFDEADVALITEHSELNTDTKRMVVQMPIPAGSSLGLGTSRLYDYMSYGLTDSNGGNAMIKIGYKKRF